MKLTAKVLDIGVPNKNGRIYPHDVAVSIVEQVDERISDGLFWGAFEDDGFSLDLAKVTHHVTGARIDGGKLMADIEFLGTPQGKKLAELYHNELLGFSANGTGTIDADGTVRNYRLMSISATLDPA